ncbi:hypothetical protein GIB67_008721 [Kingdonia uniflora]|uniref:Uncharacterized protein n=1 Tax=Kingdonia uniflora TaxID=39325 RepID=A0A7J7NGV1_9MAGN|nr:hypothetical protein GIB67_008721 [Kingdonia uniflora]
MELEKAKNPKTTDSEEEIDSSCSTPYVSAPSSPGRVANNGYFFSAPTSPMHYVSSSSSDYISSSSEFEFSSRFASSGTDSSVSNGSSMISADELFCNGQIRAMKLSSHLQRPQLLAPLLDLDNEEEEDDDDVIDPKSKNLELLRGRDLGVRNRSVHRRARSLSPLRNDLFQWRQQNADRDQISGPDLDSKQPETETPSVSASSSRSSSSGSRNTKRWEFLKDFLRSKSEGRNNIIKDKFWYSISFSDKKSKPTTTTTTTDSSSLKLKLKHTTMETGRVKPTNGVSKRRIPPSAHELHYTAKRAQAEEMKRRTYLPYRQGLFGCLGFSSKGYGAMNVFAKSLNPVSSR